MKIAYIGNHNQTNSADDEGAIAHALTELGHKVELFSEKVSFPALVRSFPDMILFHKWNDSSLLHRINCIKVSWYFDLFQEDEPVLSNRNLSRKNWLLDTLPNVHALFCTDGDMVLSYKDAYSSKLHYLTQGVDSRLALSKKVISNVQNYAKTNKTIDIFIPASVRKGTKRELFINKIKERYGHRVLHISSGCYREELIDTLSSTNIVLAPNAPVRDYYYSNRVYNMLGLGSCLVHPIVWGLNHEYMLEKDYVGYNPNCIDDAYKVIDRMLEESLETKEVLVMRGYNKTLARHTYKAKVETMMQILKREGLI